MWENSACISDQHSSLFVSIKNITGTRVIAYTSSLTLGTEDKSVSTHGNIRYSILNTIICLWKEMHHMMIQNYCKGKDNDIINWLGGIHVTSSQSIAKTNVININIIINIIGHWHSTSFIRAQAVTGVCWLYNVCSIAYFQKTYGVLHIVIKEELTQKNQTTTNY